MPTPSHTPTPPAIAADQWPDLPRTATAAVPTERSTQAFSSAAADSFTAARDLLGDRCAGGVSAVLDLIDWSEDEIQQAQHRHRRRADLLHHSFTLLTPNTALTSRMSTEFVYRAHCRELLDRVATGGDTRPATAAEICCALIAANQLSPLRPAAFGLYARMWQLAGLMEIPGLAEAGHHHEALKRSTIDDLERLSRSKLAVAERRLSTIDCPGRHHGDPVTCAYATAGSHTPRG
ncbi:hypothetical protein [Pseudonocardia kunmingensis]|uniref:Uncharacterized protein n=1 Tax=Pseudonocardia kunmingensis TaxID=630975 RepID=A0A543CX69_9PSEU|nr:hypothetical protein [Pseudonocardia kunmingensis]TQM01697.1 hypothetical protein FB558_8598 [Pseudonocardia kunmingensis]